MTSLGVLRERYNGNVRTFIDPLTYRVIIVTLDTCRDNVIATVFRLKRVRTMTPLIAFLFRLTPGA